MGRTNETVFFFAVIVTLSTCNNDEEYDYSDHTKAGWIENAFTSLEAYRSSNSSSTFITVATTSDSKHIEPDSGIYHSAYPDFGGEEDIVTAERINDFEILASKDIVWAYFSNNWRNDIHFPLTEVNIISSTVKIPFIRIMPRTGFEEGVPDPNYTMQKIIDGLDMNGTAFGQNACWKYIRDGEELIYDTGMENIEFAYT